MTILERAPFLAILAGLITAMGLEEEAGPVLLPALALLTAAGCFFYFGIHKKHIQSFFKIIYICTFIFSDS